jgi:hydroxylamine reductase
MFCFHCQETTNNLNCSVRGVCGKSPEVAVLQDMLVYALKGLSIYAVKARELGYSEPATDLFVVQALFSTLSNVNFDECRFVDLIREALARRDDLRNRFYDLYAAQQGTDFVEPLPEAATWYYLTGDEAEFAAKGATVGVMAEPQLNEDLRALRELLIYGLKGLAAYTEHTAMLDALHTEICAFVEEALAYTAQRNLDADTLLANCMTCGKVGVDAMAALDHQHTSRFGHPEPTAVNLGVVDGPAILISGHDLRDLEDLLEQTMGTGVNVYTHGEMLPAHGYPFFKKYPHLVGNYGNAWWQQQKEFESFNGAILMTTNCIQKPTRHYADRIFTTGMVGWPEIPHIADRAEGGRKDFSAVIAKALECPSPTPIEEGSITVGFARQAILSRADAVVGAIQSGAIKRFVVMAGCDGRQKERSYYTDIAAALPQDHVILTAGCAKYRYNKLPLGDINGIPRVLDAGQCNDSYSLVAVALKLAEVFGVGVNDLPIAYDIAWYEQKAVLVLLALLYLDVKQIRLGPTLPAFLTPNVINVLVEKFGLQPMGTVEADLAAITGVAVPVELV